MKKLILRVLNPFFWLRARQFKRQQKRDKGARQDAELMLYSHILRSDFLHYGYFDDPDKKPETISIADIEHAQLRYVEKVLERIQKGSSSLLDVGSGVGGILHYLREKAFEVEGLTPDPHQIQYIRAKYPDMTCHHTTLEEFSTTKQFEIITNFESFQYINMEQGMKRIDELLKPKGQWLMIDYFRKNNKGINRSGHLWEDFLKTSDQMGWEITYQEDITRHVLPMLKYLYLYVERFGRPILSYAKAKLEVKKPMFYYFVQDYGERINRKIEKEVASIDPNKFIVEKKYMLISLQRKGE